MLNNNLRIGFTGSRDGMTNQQEAAFVFLMLGLNTERALLDKDKIEFHHGCCIGADTIASKLFSRCNFPKWIVAHPPTDNRMIGKNYQYNLIKQAKPYLVRNKSIVDNADMLIACPKTCKEEQRSGTWSTIRYARKKDKIVIIILPDGKTVSGREGDKNA